MAEGLLIALRSTMDEWARTRWSDLRFSDAQSALLVFVVLLAAAVLVLIVRTVRQRRPGRTHVPLPAILPVMRHSPLTAIRHLRVPEYMFEPGNPDFCLECHPAGTQP